MTAETTEQDAATDAGPADVDALKAKVRKLASRAGQLKLDLHDLAEDLPVDWQKIPEIAQRAYDAQSALADARARLAAAEEASTS